MADATNKKKTDKVTKQLWKSTMAHPLPIVPVAIAGIVAILLAYVVEPYFNLSSSIAADSPVIAYETASDSTLRISEVMSSNRSACFTSTGEAADWLEITNTGTQAVSLRGYTLFPKDDPTATFTFPDEVLVGGEYMLIFCDKSFVSSSGEYHAPFSLPAAGTTLILADAEGGVVQEFAVPGLQKNESYALNASGEYEITAEYTPGMANTRSNYQIASSVRVESPIEITEIMADNVTYAAPDGSYADYIELHNASESPVNLGGWHLSDSADNTTKWMFPDVTIPADGYLIVWCTGESKDGDMISCVFKLSSGGEAAVLSNQYGQIALCVDYPALECDQAWSLYGGQWTIQLPPTPGYSNTYESAALLDSMLGAGNSTGLYITEVMASTDQAGSDWIELYNSTGSAVDLSGYGLSDSPDSPLKWTFPAGTTIQPGQYMGIFMSGVSGYSNGYLNADFRLSIDGGYTLCVSTPDGAIFDRMYIPEQYRNISYGRIPGKSGCYFFTSSTPGTANGSVGYASRAQTPDYSTPGGLFPAGQAVTVEMTVPEGYSIYYTLDASEPSQSSGMLYTGPITITQNTILRTCVFGGDALASYIDTQSYLFGVESTVPVVSLVSTYDNLFGEAHGIYSNYNLPDEVAGSIEIFDPETGTAFIAQGCGIKLHGDFSRKEKQKAFKIYARAEYGGGSTFDYPLFSDRDYTEYSSFLLRSSGQDTNKTRMRDSVLCALAEGTSVMYQETEICVVYINGKYWGQYYFREHITTTSICQFEGWVGQEDALDLVKANSSVFQGSNDTYAALLEWVNSHNMNTQEAWEMLDSVIDIQNFIEYMAIQIFTGNTDTLNVKRYRNPNADGKWHWVLYDLDWAFTVNTNSIGRWLSPGGMGNEKRTNNDLFIACMKNDRFRDMFLTYMGEQMATTFSSEHVLALFEERYHELEPLLPMQLEMWNESQSTYQSELSFLKNYAAQRPGLLLGYFQESMHLSDEQMEHYFGEAMDKAGYEP